MTVLYVICHAETDYNSKDIYIGRRDININNNGLNQAKFLGKLFKNKNLDLIITSSLNRARETAKIINQYI